MVTDPVCGMTIDSGQATKQEHNGHTYYFCSQHCLGKFREDPERFVKAVAPIHVVPSEQSGTGNESVTDPVCGMTVDPGSAAAKHEYNGKTYYFCSHHCAQKFKEDPEKWLHAQPAGHKHGTAS